MGRREKREIEEREQLKRTREDEGTGLLKSSRNPSAGAKKKKAAGSQSDLPSPHLLQPLMYRGDRSDKSSRRKAALLRSGIVAFISLRSLKKRRELREGEDGEAESEREREGESRNFLEFW